MTNPLPPGAESQTDSAWDWRQKQLPKGNRCWCVCTHAPICLECISIILLLTDCINHRITSICLFRLSSKKPPKKTKKTHNTHQKKLAQTKQSYSLYLHSYLHGIFSFEVFLYYANMESGVIFLRYWWSEWNPNCPSTSIVGRSPNYFGQGCILETSLIQIYFSLSQQEHCICIRNLHNNNKTDIRITIQTKPAHWRCCFAGKYFSQEKEKSQLQNWFWSVGRIKSECSTVWSCNSCAHQPRLLLPADLSHSALAGMLDLMKLNLL